MVAYSSGFSPSSAQGWLRSGSVSARVTVSRGAATQANLTASPNRACRRPQFRPGPMDDGEVLTRRTVLASTAAASLGAAATTLGAAAPADADVTVGRVLARGLRVPWGLAFLPS